MRFITKLLCETAAVAVLLSGLVGSVAVGQELLEIWYYPSYDRLRVRITPGQMAGPLDPALLHTPDGKPGLLGEYFRVTEGQKENPLPPVSNDAGMDGEQREERFEELLDQEPGLHTGNLAHLTQLPSVPALRRIDPGIDFHWGLKAPAPGIAEDGFAVRWTGRLGPIPENYDVELAVLADDGFRLWLDGQLVVDSWEKAARAPIYSGTVLEPGRTYDLRLEYYEMDGFAVCQLGYRLPEEVAAGVRSADVRLMNEDGEELQGRRMQWKDGPEHIEEMAVADLPPGTYTVEATIPGQPRPATCSFVRKHFPWEGCRLGITDRIYPPFEPIAVEGREVRVVRRCYTVGGLGLWDSVQARGQNGDAQYRELLARPVALVVNGTDRLEGTGDFVDVRDGRVVYEGQAGHPAVSVHTKTITDYDGCMKVELSLAPAGDGRELQSLTLEIPLCDDEAPLQHVVRGSRPLRHNLAGATWPGTGEVFSSEKLADPRWPSTFRPYWWFGSESRGLAWFADNERGWTLDLKNNSPCQTVHRENGALIFRAHLVQKPVRIDAPRTIVFGLMASPAKPMPDNWRKAGRRGEMTWTFSMPTLFGMPGRYQARCPIAEDYTLFDHAQARRLGAGADPEYVGRVMANRHDPGNRTGFAGRIVPGTQRYQNYGGHLSVYFEEFFSTSVMHKEAWIYQSEWASSKITPPQQVPPFVVPWIYDWAFYTPGHPPSYRDFGAWHAANWLRRGFGLYFDNSMPKRALDPVATSAFQREDGQVVPSCGIWAHREYLKRIWVLHQQFYNPHTPQIMMIHMTNTHILPYHVWNQVNLDLEWKFRVNALFQEKFGHDLLRAESLGLQTGNYPTAMAGASKADAAWLKLHAARYERTRWAGLLVHEIKGGIPLQPYPKLFEEFGYGLDDAVVFNYWDRRPVLHVNDPEVKWLLVERQGRALLLVCTWNPEPASLVIDVDSERLGFTPQQASDAEADTKPDGRVRFGEASETMGAGSEDSDEPKIGENWRWDASRNRLSLPMPGYGVRIALLE